MTIYLGSDLIKLWLTLGKCRIYFFAIAVLKTFFIFLEEERKKEEFIPTRPVGFAAGKNQPIKKVQNHCRWLSAIVPVWSNLVALLRGYFHFISLEQHCLSWGMKSDQAVGRGKKWRCKVNIFHLILTWSYESQMSYSYLTQQTSWRPESVMHTW